MDSFLDTAWEYIAGFILNLGEILFSFLQHFHFLGPVVLIAALAFLTVAFTKLLSRFIVTKRYEKLEKEFSHWYQVRQEALKHSDSEKGRQLARNIDQAELNKVYYDYFFEGLLLGIARKVIPIFFMFAFVNEYYKPANLLRHFNREYVFMLNGQTAEAVAVGAPFYFIMSVLSSYLLWYFLKKILPLPIKHVSAGKLDTAGDTA